MTIADTPFGDSFGKERCAGLKKMADGTGNMVVGDRINRPAYIRQCLSKVFLPIAADHGALAKRGDMGISLYSLMKGGNKARYLFEKFRPGGSSPHTRFQRRIIRQTLHNDRVIHHQTILDQRARRRRLFRRKWGQNVPAHQTAPALAPHPDRHPAPAAHSAAPLPRKSGGAALALSNQRIRSFLAS